MADLYELRQGYMSAGSPCPSGPLERQGRDAIMDSGGSSEEKARRRSCTTYSQAEE